MVSVGVYITNMLGVRSQYGVGDCYGVMTDRDFKRDAATNYSDPCTKHYPKPKVLPGEALPLNEIQDSKLASLKTLNLRTLIQVPKRRAYFCSHYFFAPVAFFFLACLL